MNKNHGDKVKLVEGNQIYYVELVYLETAEFNFNKKFLDRLEKARKD